MTMIVIALKDEENGGRSRRALASIQHFKELAFRTASGKFARASVDFAYPTSPDTPGRINQVIELHKPKTYTGKGLIGESFTFCSYCDGHPSYPCETVRILTGAEK